MYSYEARKHSCVFRRCAHLASPRTTDFSVQYRLLCPPFDFSVQFPGNEERATDTGETTIILSIWQIVLNRYRKIINYFNNSLSPTVLVLYHGIMVTVEYRTERKCALLARWQNYNSRQTSTVVGGREQTPTFIPLLCSEYCSIVSCPLPLFLPSSSLPSGLNLLNSRLSIL